MCNLAKPQIPRRMGRSLRSPLANFAPAVGLARGSECDSLDDWAFYLFLLHSARKLLACGRLHLTPLTRPRYDLWRLTRMRVVAATGVAFSRDEAEAARRGAQKLVLNARDNATEFYARHNYVVVGEAETLFGVIRHVRMVN